MDVIYLVSYKSVLLFEMTLSSRLVSCSCIPHSEVFLLDYFVSADLQIIYSSARKFLCASEVTQIVLYEACRFFEENVTTFVRSGYEHVLTFKNNFLRVGCMSE